MNDRDCGNSETKKRSGNAPATKKTAATVQDAHATAETMGDYKSNENLLLQQVEAQILPNCWQRECCEQLGRTCESGQMQLHMYIKPPANVHIGLQMFMNTPPNVQMPCKCLQMSANVCKCLQMSEPLQMLLQMFANSGECPHPCKCLQISVQMWTLCTAFPRVLLLTYTTFSASPRAPHEVRRHAARLIYRCAKKMRLNEKKTSKEICGLKKFDYFCSTFTIRKGATMHRTRCNFFCTYYAIYAAFYPRAPPVIGRAHLFEVVKQRERKRRISVSKKNASPL